MATKRRAAADSAAAKNQPLIDDIRLLGRILGDIIREQEGEEAFDLIEAIRQLAVAYRLKRNAAAGRALDRLLTSLSDDQTVSVVRAFSYFSLLANIAEDRHHMRRRAGTSAQGHLPRRLAAGASSGWRGAASRADEIARDARRTPAISPVLTAHPTEVQRKSTLDAERAIAELLAARGRARRSARGGATTRRCCGRRVTQLWQTRMLRNAKLTVRDEIENALSYFRSTFLRADPASSIARSRSAAAAASRSRRFFRMGSWIGGDRDGNPFVTAETLADRAGAPGRDRAAPLPDRGARARRRAVDLGDPARRVTPELQALAERSGDDSPHRADEPYRRALIGIYARLAATLSRAHRHRGAAPRGRRRARPTPTRRRCSPTCARSRRRCAAITPRPWSRRASRR